MAAKAKTRFQNPFLFPGIEGSYIGARGADFRTVFHKADPGVLGQTVFRTVCIFRVKDQPGPPSLFFDFKTAASVAQGQGIKMAGEAITCFTGNGVRRGWGKKSLEKGLLPLILVYS